VKHKAAQSILKEIGKNFNLIRSFCGGFRGTVFSKSLFMSGGAAQFYLKETLAIRSQKW
jgi:hypothetical protein